MKIYQKFDEIVIKHNLPEAVKNDIVDLCDDAYIKGGNACFDIHCKQQSQGLLMKTTANTIPTIKAIVKQSGFVLYLYFNTDEFGFVDFQEYLATNPNILNADKLSDLDIFSSVFVENGLKWKKLPCKKTIGGINLNDYFSIGGDTIYKYSRVWYPNISELALLVRKQNNLTQAQLAEKLKISVSKLSSIEQQKSSITMQIAKRIFTFF